MFILLLLYIGPVRFEKFEVQHKNSCSIAQSNKDDENGKVQGEKEKKDGVVGKIRDREDDEDEKLKEEDDNDYDYDDDPEFKTDMSKLSKEEQSKIIDSLVRDFKSLMF